jgi:hypothetical protein
MKFFASIAFLLLTSASLCAQDPVDPPALPLEAKIVLVAPDSITVGELARFDVSESIGESFRWIMVPDSNDFEIYDGGKRAVFSARKPGDYRFIVACALGDTVDVVTHVIHVKGPLAEPTTNSLAEWIPYWRHQLNLPANEVLAVGFASIAANADDLPTPEEWISATATLTRSVLGDDLEMWQPLLEKIGKALGNMQLQTPEAHAAVWMEIADGFRS